MDNFEQNYLKPVIKQTTNPRVGVITLSTDFTIEQDFRKICHDLPLDIFFNRIPFINPLNYENYLKQNFHPHFPLRLISLLVLVILKNLVVKLRDPFFQLKMLHQK